MPQADTEFCARIREIKALMAPLEAEVCRLCQLRDIARSPFQPGDIIEWRVGMRHRTRRGAVVQVREGAKSWFVNVLRKNGSVSNVQAAVSQWHDPIKVDPRTVPNPNWKNA